MATVKAVSSRASLVNAIKYITSSEKTNEKICTSFNCSDPDVIQSMTDTKYMWKKTGGRQYYHVVQSFSPEENITSEGAHALAVKLANHIWGDEYEYVVATHIDRDHIHSHIIANSVSFTTGKKFNNTRRVLEDAKEFSDQCCRENDLSITVKGQHFDGTPFERGEISTSSTKTYRKINKDDSYLSYIHEAIECVLDERVESKAEFINSCYEDFGITVIWDDNHKYITFEDNHGNKVRNKRLSEIFNEDYSKDGLIERLHQNSIQYEIDEVDSIESGIKEFGDRMLDSSDEPEYIRPRVFEADPADNLEDELLVRSYFASLAIPSMSEEDPQETENTLELDDMVMRAWAGNICNSFKVGVLVVGFKDEDFEEAENLLTMDEVPFVSRIIAGIKFVITAFVEKAKELFTEAKLRCTHNVEGHIHYCKDSPCYITSEYQTQRMLAERADYYISR